MFDKKYMKLKQKIETIIKKKNKIILLNENCTTAMYDMYGVKSCEKIEKRAKKHNEKALARAKKYDEVITEILLLMIQLGYSIEEVISEYEITDLVSNTPKLSSYLSNESKKRK